MQLTCNNRKIAKTSYSLGIYGILSKPSIVMNLIVYMHKKGSNYNNFTEKSFNFVVKDGNFDNYYLDFTGSAITIGGREKKIAETNQFPSIMIYPRDFSVVKQIFDLATEWFSDKYIDLFKYDSNDVPFEVNKEKYKKIGYLAHLKYGQDNYLAIKPAVIVTVEGNYKGILLVCNKGILGSITYDEFLNLKYTLEDTSKNFHSMVLQIATLSLTYKQSEEGENK